MSLTQMIAVGSKPVPEQRARGLTAAFQRVGVGGGAHFEGGNPRHRVQHRLHAFVDRAEHRMVAHEAELAVAQAVQVVDYLFDAAAVIDADVGDVSARRADVVKDHRNAAFVELLDELGCHFRNNRGQAGNAAADHQTDAGD